MSTLKDEISTYEGMRDDLETQHFGEWVVIHDGEFVGSYDSFESAADDAVRRFGRGPYLIRQVGAPPVTLTASIFQDQSLMLSVDVGLRTTAALQAAPIWSISDRHCLSR